MAKTLTSTVDIRLKWEHTNTPDTGGPAVKDHNTFVMTDSLANGTALDQCDLLWHDIRTLAATTSEDIDLAGGISDQFGATVTFAKVRGLVIRNQTTAAGIILEVGGAASNEWSAPFGAAGDKVKIGPDGSLALWNPSAAGFAVTGGSADTLKIYNSGSASSTYQIVIVGSSA